MKPLTLDDLIRLEQYVAEREDHALAAARYLDRYRRVRVGPLVTLVFENRQTLWFRAQELVRTARLVEPSRLQSVLDFFNRLLPAPNRLQAAMHVGIPDGPRWATETAAWRDLADSAVALRLGSRTCPSRLVTARPEDRCYGVDHWLEFLLIDDDQALLRDATVPVSLGVHHRDYRHESPPLTEATRRSLLDDLTVSQRNAA